MYINPCNKIFLLLYFFMTSSFSTFHRAASQNQMGNLQSKTVNVMIKLLRYCTSYSHTTLLLPIIAKIHLHLSVFICLIPHTLTFLIFQILNRLLLNGKNTQTWKICRGLHFHFLQTLDNNKLVSLFFTCSQIRILLALVYRSQLLNR